MKSRFAFILTIITTVLVIGFTGLYLTREFTKVYTFVNMGDMWSMLGLSEERSFASFTEIDLNDFPHPPYPERYDFLTEVDGLPATSSNYFSVFNQNTPPGKEIEIKFSHESTIYTTTVVTRSIPSPTSFQVWVMFILRVLITGGLIFVGLWGFIRKSASSPVRALTFFCYALAIEMSFTRAHIADAYAAFQIPHWVFFIFVSLCLVSPAFWLKLHLLFPKRNRVYEKYRLLFNVLFFLPAAILCALWARSNLIFPTLEATIYQSVFMGTGFILLVRNHHHAESFLEKRQTRLVLWGSAPGISLYVLVSWFVYIFSNFAGNWSYRLNMLVTNITFLFVLLIPISFVYAFGKYKLLEVEGKLKRGTRLIVVNLLLLFSFFGFLYIFGEFILAKIGISSQTPTLILGIMLAIAFVPTQSKIRSRLEKYFYPERLRLRYLLKDFLASSMVKAEGSEFWKELEVKLADGLSAEKIYPVLRIQNNSGFAVELEEPAPFGVTDEIIKRLWKNENPMLLDEIIASGRIILTDEQKEWFISRKSAVLLPLVAKSGLIGFLVISCKTNGEDFTTEELELLSNFSAQTALVAENLELLSEKIEKQKLEEQLRVARDIQKGLLPKDIPVIRGLEVEALIRFCLDVAGDYYDIISLPDGNIVFAVGDVAGKGVGPALLMANLQASLRTTQEIGISLEETAEKINRIIYENTPPDLFITFFVVKIDSNTGKLSYVNAGHNPPILARRNGEIEILKYGGLLLGVEPITIFKESTSNLNDGDVLLLYTDGVSEARNSREEEFGEDRIIEILRKGSSLPLQDLLNLIEKTVEEFHGSSEYLDDFTMLAIRKQSMQATKSLE